jgi:hypothetical protein
MNTGKRKRQKAGQLDAVYRETFSAGPGAWTSGKAAPDGTWHRNILGERGKPVPLGWSKEGGRHGGYAYGEPPWYFDDNHGEFMWLYLVLFVNRSELIGLSGRDLGDAQVKLSIRGRDFNPKGAELFFWIQGRPPEGAAFPQQALYNWALTSQPVTEPLLGGEWRDRTVTLVPDEGQWTFMGHLNGGLSKRIRVIQSLTAGKGTLDAILGGTHVNFGFLLCGVDPNDAPTGRIEIDEITILARKAKD